MSMGAKDRSQNAKRLQTEDKAGSRRDSERSIISWGKISFESFERHEEESEKEAKWSRGYSSNSSKDSKWATLCVGGAIHKIQWYLLRNAANTRLGRLANFPNQWARLCDGFEEGVYHFDRDPRIFYCVIGYYRSGKLHFSDGICVISFADELAYWGLDECNLEPCCQYKFFNLRESLMEDVHQEIEILKTRIEDEANSGCCYDSRAKVWKFLEKPETRSAKIAAIISILFIVLSCIAFIVNTIPGVVRSVNGHEVENRYLYFIEVLCIVYFSIEYVVRFWASPDRIAFMKSPLNAIDLLTILPFYMQHVLVLFTDTGEEGFEKARRVIQLFRMMRVLRILKLARHSADIRSLGKTVTSSSREFGMLGSVMLIAVTIFSSFIYFAEKDYPGSKFTSIPASFWWASITMTTVGYGDIYPKTIIGKFIGAFCCMCGVIVIATPIPIIVNNFAEFYKRHIRSERAAKLRADIALAKAANQMNPLQFSLHSLRRLSTMSIRGSVDSAGSTQVQSTTKSLPVFNTNTAKRHSLSPSFYLGENGEKRSSALKKTRNIFSLDSEQPETENAAAISCSDGNKKFLRSKSDCGQNGLSVPEITFIVTPPEDNEVSAKVQAGKLVKQERIQDANNEEVH